MGVVSASWLSVGDICEDSGKECDGMMSVFSWKISYCDFSITVWHYSCSMYFLRIYSLYFLLYFDTELAAV